MAAGGFELIDASAIKKKAYGSGVIDFATMEAEAFISVDEYIGKQPMALSMESRNGGRTAFGSYGDYSCIVGSSKSRKTWLKSAIVSGYIGGQANNYFPEIMGHDTKGKYVIDIDTEQSKYHSQWVFKRVIKMVGQNTPYYRSFSLRKYSAEQRLAFIDWLITKSKYSRKIGLIAIDGYADLVADFNSLEQSNNLQQHLLGWTDEYQCHITGVLHKNFGSDKPVGHVGSAVLKKAETVVFAERENEKTWVSCEYARNAEFDKFGFVIGNDLLPYSEKGFSGI